jgi:hypothetical protein
LARTQLTCGGGCVACCLRSIPFNREEKETSTEAVASEMKQITIFSVICVNFNLLGENIK